jgi:hypothetical protein
MSERKPYLYWPWAIRAFALFLPVLYLTLSSPNAFNLARSPSLPVVGFLVLLAALTCIWYRGKCSQ